MDAYCDIEKLAGEVGFEHYGRLNVSALAFRPEVRDMCASNRCNNYGKSWVCPPACGDLESISAKVEKYGSGVIVQSVGMLEDDFDYESIEKLLLTHQQRFSGYVEKIRAITLDFLPMSAGACTICKDCTYPHSPCRFPERAVPSMEAYGLIVSDICNASGIAYYYGTRTISFTSCVLFG